MVYQVQVSTDSQFKTLVVNKIVPVITEYKVNEDLDYFTVYYWRVAPVNGSCTGNFSSNFSFTTGIISCNSYSSTNIPVTIPTTVATVTSTLTIPSGMSISDINVTLNITHSWINDLTATLTSPAGTVVTLFANQCSPNSSVNDIAATFDDSGIAITCGNAPGISGTVLPAQALSDFNGQDSTGLWTLTVSDAFNQDGGSIDSWTLDICSAAPLAVDENQLENFSIYPNPNHGAFTIQFNSSSSDAIVVGVHDMRGREVFTKTYTNNGVFNESLQLNNLQAGVYLVSILDGAKKLVKKIIVE